MSRSMTCLVVEHSPELRESLCYLLLAYGVRGIPAATRTQALAIVESERGIDAAIVDVDNRDVDGTALLKDLKARKPPVRLIVHSVQSDRRFVAGMNAAGVVGHILKPFDEERTAAALRRLFLDQAGTDKREHLRVRPEAGELLRASFRLTAGGRLISGRVINISIGGAAIDLYRPPAAESIREGWRIPALEFNLGARSLAPSGVIILYRKGILAVRFEQLSRQQKTILARYVFKKLTDD